MSKLKEIIMHGIKGQNTTQQLTGRDIILGHNGAGKTTRAQALGIGLLGHVPGGGKLPAETAKLATENEMTVGVKTDTFEVLRTYTKKAGKVEVNIDLSPSKAEKSATAKEQRITEELGRFPAMLDFGEFLNLTDTKRREFIYNLLGDSGEVPEDEQAWFYKQLSNRVKGPAGEGSVLAEVLFEASCDFENKRKDVQHGLKIVHDRAKEEVSYWKKERELANNAALKVTEQKNELTTTDRDKDLVEAQLEAATKRKQELELELATWEVQAGDVLRKNKRLGELRAAIQEGAADETEELERTIHSYKSEIQNVNTSEERTTLTAEIEACDRLIADLTKEREVHKNEYLKKKAKIAGKKELAHKLQTLNGVCAIDCNIQCGQNFTNHVQNLRGEIEEETRILNEITAAGSNARAQLDAAIAEQSNAREKIDTLNQAEIEVHKKNLELGAIVAELEKKLFTAGAEVEKREAMRREIQELAPPESEYWEMPEAEELRKAIEGAAEETKTLKEKLDEIKKAQNAIASIQGSMTDEKEAGLQLDLWKQVAEATGPKGLQMEVITGALEPLKDSVQAKLNQMGIEKNFFFQTKDEAGKEVFQFGWEVDGSSRNFNALSTGEQLLLLIALMTTIIEKTNPPLKMLVLDNTENLDKENLQKVLAGLELAGKEIDNIVFIGVLTLEEDVPGWTVWNLDETVSADE